VPTFALVDGNSFYCSCERAFDPRLRGKPVVVLSNNDGCVIARTAEAKAVGIGMGDPWHLIKDRPALRDVIWFSSNYALYADMSRRMFEVLNSFSPDVEPYSIDEMFMLLDGLPDRNGIGSRIREAVLGSAKIPTCVGIGPTKTIAKLANRIAKKTPGLEGVCDLSDVDVRRDVYRTFPVADVWGVGPSSVRKLARHGVETVAQFLELPAFVVRKELSVTGARIHQELTGISCLPLSDLPSTRKGLAVTRSFGQPVATRQALTEAVAAFADRASEKLRQGDLVAGHLTVFIRTSDFKPGPRYSNLASMTIERTSDSLALVSLASRAAARLWRDGYAYAKAGVMLTDLSPRQQAPADLFPSREPSKVAKLMEAIDRVNAVHGRGALRPALVGFRDKWKPRQGNLSNRFTTDLRELMEVVA